MGRGFVYIESWMSILDPFRFQFTELADRLHSGLRKSDRRWIVSTSPDHDHACKAWQATVAKVSFQ